MRLALALCIVAAWFILDFVAAWIIGNMIRRADADAAWAAHTDREPRQNAGQHDGERDGQVFVINHFGDVI